MSCLDNATLLVPIKAPSVDLDKKAHYISYKRLYLYLTQLHIIFRGNLTSLSGMRIPLSFLFFLYIVEYVLNMHDILLVAVNNQSVNRPFAHC